MLASFANRAEVVSRFRAGLARGRRPSAPPGGAAGAEAPKAAGARAPKDDEAAAGAGPESGLRERRERLSFGLDAGDIARHWLAGDPFRTRFFDAFSTMFPAGERFFIESVRAFREGLDDPELARQVNDFFRQEGQHIRVHLQDVARLRAQGVDVDAILRRNATWMHRLPRRLLPARYALAVTAACEHVTAVNARAIFSRRAVMAGADPRMRAMYAWHALEEVEHRSVAFDVMRRRARVGYALRALAMAQASLVMVVLPWLIAERLLADDGFSPAERLRLCAGGLWWVLKPGGFLTPELGEFLRYFDPAFHPSHGPPAPGWQAWVEAYARTGDPVAAGDAMHAAGA